MSNRLVPDRLDPGSPLTAPEPQQGLPSSPEQVAQPTAQHGVPQGSPADISTVAAAVGRLENVHELALHEQPDVYQAVHAELQNALAAIDHA